MSPPLKEKPEFKLKGKNLLIDLNNKLRDSATYTLSFGDGIADLNENNPLKNYQFVFSTGNKLDSLSATGSVLDAFSLQPADGIQVFLYDNLKDSTPYNEIPAYAVKTEKTGIFSLNNLKAGTYRLFALKDANSNLKFDLANEKIAFLDSLITPSVQVSDKIDTLKTKEKKDSIVKHSVVVFSPKNIKLYLFEEDNQKQYLSNNDRPEKYKCAFIFNRPLVKDIEIYPLNFTPEKDWFFFEKSLKNDTVVCWIKDTVVANKDTLKLQMKYLKTDSAGKLSLFSDTLKLKVKQRPALAKNQKQPAKLPLKINVSNNGILDLNMPVIMEWGRPIGVSDTALIRLFRVKDSTETRQNYYISEDTSAKKLIGEYCRKYLLNAKWDEGTSYRLKVFPGAWRDIYGFTNDTSIINFKTQKKDYYGNMVFKFKNCNSPVIVQLMDIKETILNDKVIRKDQTLKYEYLKPQKYKLKVIFDKNDNGKWDTGKYLEKRQPEKALYYQNEINVRSNWDIELEWKLE